MTCRELITFLMDYLDGALPAPERARFDDHLRICAACRVYLQSYRDTVSLERLALAHGHGAAVPDDIPEELITAILEARSGRN